jgi:hypothetical protein
MIDGHANYAEFAGGEVRAWTDQGDIVLKAVSGADPVEMTETDAEELAAWLLERVRDARS